MSDRPQPKVPFEHLECRKETIRRKVGYGGFSVTFQDTDTNSQVALIAPSPAALESLWNRIKPLDHDGSPLKMDWGKIQDALIVGG